MYESIVRIMATGQLLSNHGHAVPSLRWQTSLQLLQWLQRLLKLLPQRRRRSDTSRLIAYSFNDFCLRVTGFRWIYPMRNDECRHWSGRSKKCCCRRRRIDWRLEIVTAVSGRHSCGLTFLLCHMSIYLSIHSSIHPSILLSLCPSICSSSVS